MFVKLLELNFKWAKYYFERFVEFMHTCYNILKELDIFCDFRFKMVSI